MNVIFTTSSDYTTNRVADWLLYQENPFYCLNTDWIFQTEEINEIPDIQLTLNQGQAQFVIDGVPIFDYWLRRVSVSRSRDYEKLRVSQIKTVFAKHEVFRK